MLKDGELAAEGDDQPYVFEESPSCQFTLTYHEVPTHSRVVINGTMRGYQLQGLNWMVSLHHNGLNGILADEMVCVPLLHTPQLLNYGCRVSVKHFKPSHFFLILDITVLFMVLI